MQEIIMSQGGAEQLAASKNAGKRSTALSEPADGQQKNEFSGLMQQSGSNESAAGNFPQGQSTDNATGNELPQSASGMETGDSGDTGEFDATLEIPLDTVISQDDLQIDPSWQAYFSSLPASSVTPHTAGSTSATGNANAAVARPAAMMPVVGISSTEQLVNGLQAQASGQNNQLQKDTEALPVQSASLLKRGDSLQFQPQNSQQPAVNASQQENQWLLMQSSAQSDSGQTGRNGYAASGLFTASILGSTKAGNEQAAVFSSVMAATSPSLATPSQSINPVMQSAITEPFGSAGWSQGLGKQVMMMVNQNIQTAELRMNPAHLGPVEVRLEMDDDQVNVAFSSRHAVVREAMESALPRLREMLEQNGLDLAGTDISHQSFAEQGTDQGTGNEGSSGTGIAMGEDGDGLEHDRQQRDAVPASLDTLVDYYI